MIHPIEQNIDIPPASPTGLYDTGFQTKVVNLLGWFSTMVVQFTTFIEKLNVFAQQVNASIPLINNGLPVGDYGGSATNTFEVAPATDPTHAVQLSQLSSISSAEIGEVKYSSSPTIDSGWWMWHEDTVIGALVADFPLFAVSNSVLISNLDTVAGTFDFQGHEGRYFRPDGTTVSAGATLEDEVISHTHPMTRGIAFDAGSNRATVGSSGFSPIHTGAFGGTENLVKTIGLYAKIYIGDSAPDHIVFSRTATSPATMVVKIRASVGDTVNVNDVNYVGLGATVDIVINITENSVRIAKHSMTNLVYLNLSGTSVTGNIGQLSALTNLAYLYLYNTSVTGDIGQLSTLTNLTRLLLYRTSVTGDIGQLSALQNLAYLYLYRTSVTGDIDAQLEALVTLNINTCIIKIGDNGTAITPVGEAHKVTLEARGNTVTIY